MRHRTLAPGRPRVEPLEVRRLMAIGDLDDSFGTGGTVELPREGGATGFGLFVPHLSTLSDGRIVAAGSDGERPYFQRLGADGAIDASFANAALIDALAARIGKPLDAAAAAGDRVIVRGHGIAPGNAPVLTAVAAGRRLPRIDPAFGKRGIIHLPFAATGAFSDAASLVVLPDGRIVATGLARVSSAETGDSSGTWGMTVVRPDGRIDAAFGGGDGVIELGRVFRSFDPQEGLPSQSELITAERIFGLADDRILYVRERTVSERFSFDEPGTTVPTVEALILGVDGTAATIAGFDRVGRIGVESRQLPDGSVQIVFASTAPSTATIAADGSFAGVTPGLPSGAIPADTVFSTDGQRLDTLEPSEGEVLVAKYQTSDAPTGLLHARPLRHLTRSYKFAVTWHDDDELDVATLSAARPTVIVDLPDGTTRTAHFVSADPSADATTVRARYHLTHPSGEWNSNDNGVYRVRLRRGEVADASGRTASGRVLGQFVVDIPAPPSPPRPPDFERSAAPLANVLTGGNASVWTRDLRGGPDEDPTRTVSVLTVPPSRSGRAGR